MLLLWLLFKDSLCVLGSTDGEIGSAYSSDLANVRYGDLIHCSHSVSDVTAEG